MSKIEKVGEGNSQEIIPAEYESLENVKLCQRKLIENLGKPKVEWDIVKNIFYNMLTVRSKFVEMSNKFGNNLNRLIEEDKVVRHDWEEYNEKLMPEMEKEIKKKNFKTTSNPGWFNIHTAEKKYRREGLSYKEYMTIPIDEYHFVKSIPQLADSLGELSIETKDLIKMKFPLKFLVFMAHNDSLVIHYRNPESGLKIRKILNSWREANNITKAPREMGRTESSIDPPGTSFTNHVTEKMVEWMQEHKEKYNNDVLAKSAIKYAIELSQVSPKVVR